MEAMVPRVSSRELQLWEQQGSGNRQRQYQALDPILVDSEDQPSYNRPLSSPRPTLYRPLETADAEAGVGSGFPARGLGTAEVEAEQTDEQVPGRQGEQGAKIVLPMAVALRSICRCQAAPHALAAGAAAALLCVAALAAGAAWQIHHGERADTLDTHPLRSLQASRLSSWPDFATYPEDAPGRGAIRQASDDSLGRTSAASDDWARRNFGGEHRRHASAHLYYHGPRMDAQAKSWFHMLSPQRSADDTYFAVQGNMYGYFGMQQVRGFPWFQGKVVFSMWDQPGKLARIVECGKNVVCTRFGGEGTGAKTYMTFNKWSLGREYGFFVRSHEIGYMTVRQEAYLFAAELGGWNLMSVLEVEKEDQRLPWDLVGLYSFVEQWSKRDFANARWARFGPSYLQYVTGRADPGQWTQLKLAWFRQGAASGEDINNCYANVTDWNRRWGLGIGGGVGLLAEKTPLKVGDVPDLPMPLRKFIEMDHAGRLPRGCAGGTCPELYPTMVYDFFFQPEALWRTALMAGIVMTIACTVGSLVCGKKRGGGLGAESMDNLVFGAYPQAAAGKLLAEGAGPRRNPRGVALHMAVQEGQPDPQPPCTLCTILATTSQDQ